jgi:hypothetical protein
MRPLSCSESRLDSPTSSDELVRAEPAWTPQKRIRRPHPVPEIVPIVLIGIRSQSQSTRSLGSRKLPYFDPAETTLGQILRFPQPSDIHRDVSIMIFRTARRPHMVIYGTKNRLNLPHHLRINVGTQSLDVRTHMVSGRHADERA